MSWITFIANGVLVDYLVHLVEIKRNKHVPSTRSQTFYAWWQEVSASRMGFDDLCPFRIGQAHLCRRTTPESKTSGAEIHECEML